MADRGLGGDAETAGQVPQTPPVPRVPPVPPVPETMQVTDVGETPQVPDLRDTVEVPENPEVPENLEILENLEVPDDLEVPENRENRENRESPEIAENSAEEMPVKLAEPAQRLVARIIDMFVVGLPVVLLAQALLPRAVAETAEPVATALLLLVYDSLQHARWGQTPGKRLTGTRVMTVTGEPLDLPRALLRAAVFAVPIAARPVPILGVLAGIVWVGGVALMLRAGRGRQALHDQLAGTVVVSVRE